MKRFIAIVMMCFTLFTCLAGCNLGEQNKEVIDENFYCKVIDENNIAIGNVKTYPESGVVFFPEKIKNYIVSRLGFSLGIGGNGEFSPYSSGENKTIIKRIYVPHTVKEVDSFYMNRPSQLKIFYCGEVIDFRGFDDGRRGCEIYVPAEKYELFKELQDKYFNGILLKANVSYHLNYDEDNYYYVDYYENGEKILYIPPIPQRDGYTFGGWFKEADCINQWDFDTDTLQLSEEIEEIKLYAKWIVEQ